MDLSQYKSISIGGISVVKVLIGGVVAWAKKTFTNQVPISTDTDGSIYNGVGYKDNVRLSSSGGVSSSAQNGSTTTGFIPWYGDTTYLRMKGVEFISDDKHYYVNFYNASKSFLTYISAATIADVPHVVTKTVENGVTTIKYSETYGTSNAHLQNVRQASFIRITAKGKGADMIVTLNEEI